MSLRQSEWFTEIYGDETAFAVRYARKLFDGFSDFQKVEIFDTKPMGRVLVLDGCFMVTEKDSFIYHEMLVHPAMSMLQTPRRALVIGGGDGGTVTELVKYSELESVVLCEIDPMVISACRDHLPSVAAGLSDPRVEIVCRDGAAYVSEFPESFDVVLSDSTDPVGPGKVLFETPFYEAVKRSLKKGGVAVFQTESPLFMEEVFAQAVADLGQVFGAAGARPYLATIPSYPGALWSFTFCSQTVDPLAKSSRRDNEVVQKTLRYYDPEVHKAAFALPPFARQLLERTRA